jgi:hypothetical protein
LSLMSETQNRQTDRQSQTEGEKTDMLARFVCV